MTSLDVRGIDTSELRKTARPRTKHELQVFIAEAAFDRAVERGTKDTTREIGGVLVGEVLHDDSGPYLNIETTIDALHADEKGAELTFTHATWDHIHKEMDTRHQGKRVVGWYHTHPGFGVFLSDRDQFIHKSFFNLPFQVALVYDPKSKEHGVFSWRDNEVWRMRRYAIGAREHTWDGNRTAAQPTDKKAKPVEQADDRAGRDEPRRRGRDERDDDDDRIGALGTFVMVAVVLVLLAGFVGHWIGASRAGAVVTAAQVEVAKARAEGTQLAVASLQNELVGVLRETLGDQAVQRPVRQAIAEVDSAIAALQATLGPAAAGGAPDPAAAAGGAPAPAQAVAQLQAIRERLLQLGADRGSAEATLAAIQHVTRQGAELRVDLVREVAEQRAGVGSLYAELAADVAKAGDAQRARRLLATAAHLDPGNRARYEAQLRTFDPRGTLPRAAGGEPRPRPVAPEGPSAPPPSAPAQLPSAPPPSAPALPPSARAVPPSAPAPVPAPPSAPPAGHADGGTR
ncbi:MAG: Mov34/MPN/PAD-1 family protein [Myxococcales bacterium]|nr:Mov34/MPN/PAD-1 family protein [Myxococcales bacterium]